MKTIGTPASFGLWLAVISLAGCGAQAGSKIAEGVVPAANSNVGRFEAGTRKGYRGLPG